jgi:hypothetical protein
MPAYFCFIDLEKAFERLELKKVLNILEVNNVPNGLVLLIKDLTRGVRQGDLLFNLVMN